MAEPSYDEMKESMRRKALEAEAQRLSSTASKVAASPARAVESAARGAAEMAENVTQGLGRAVLPRAEDTPPGASIQEIGARMGAGRGAALLGPAAMAGAVATKSGGLLQAAPTVAGALSPNPYVRGAALTGEGPMLVADMLGLKDDYRELLSDLENKGIISINPEYAKQAGVSTKYTRYQNSGQ